jgi:hypothetical protein
MEPVRQRNFLTDLLQEKLGQLINSQMDGL